MLWYRVAPGHSLVVLQLRELGEAAFFRVRLLAGARSPGAWFPGTLGWSTISGTVPLLLLMLKRSIGRGRGSVLRPSRVPRISTRKFSIKPI